MEHAPVRRGLHDFVKFPHIGDRIPGDLIVQRMTASMNADPDRAIWLENLHRINAGYLVVMKHDSADLDADPPELKFAMQQYEAGMFERIYSDDGGDVFRIHWK